MSLILLWLLMVPLGVVIYGSAYRTFFVPEFQQHLEQFARRLFVVPFALILAMLTILAYWTSFWAPRRRRPRVALVLLMLPWSALLGGWWMAVNHNTLMYFSEWLLMALFVLGPPVALLGLEAVVGEIVFARGMRLFQQGQPLPATRLLRVAERVRPGEAAITKTVGLALFRAREYEAAEEWLARARRAYPRDRELSWPLASLALRRRAWEEAVIYLREHLEEHARDNAAWERLTEAHLALGQLDRAIKAFEHLDRPGDIAHLTSLAELYLRAKDHDRVLATAQRIRTLERTPWPQSSELLSRVVEERPTFIPALEMMAAHAAELDRPEEVLRWRERILAQRPDDIALRRTVMQQCRELHQLVTLEGHLRHVLKSEEPAREDLAEMIDLLVQRRAWEELDAWIERAKAHHPDAWEFLIAEAQIALYHSEWERCFQLCHMARARAMSPQDLRRIDALLARLARARSQNELEGLRQAISTSPDPLPLRWELVERLVQLRAFDLVVAELDEILRRDPPQRDRVTATLSQLLEKNAENFTLLNYQRDLLMRIGDHDGVFRTSERMAVQSLNPDQVMRESCERLLQANPAHLLSLRWLTDHAHRTGDWAHAVELFEALMKVAPETAEDLEQLQRYFEALAGIQDLERGVEVARRLLDRHHREVENLKILARLYQQHGQLDEARRCFLCAREVDNQDRELHDAIATLDEEIRQDRIHEIEMLLEKEPENTALHHELGDLFYSFKRYTEAIPHLQRAEADPAIANLCRAKIAHALALRGMLDLAHETLAEVKLDAQSPEQLETLKAIHFNVGEIFREAGQSERALDAFKRLFRVDAGYRNVVQKLEKLTR